MRYPWSKGPKPAPAPPAPKPPTCRQRRQALNRRQRKIRDAIAGMEPALF